MVSLVFANRVLYKFVLVFSSVLIGIGGVSNAFAAPVKATASSVQSEDRYLNINGKMFRYHIDYFQNQHGEREMQVSLVEAHWLAKDSKLVVLRGRDTDSDNLIDAWFYTEGHTVKTIKQAAKKNDAWPIASEILRQFSLNESRWISTLILKEVLGELFSAAEGEFKDANEIEEMQINLLDLDYKIAALENSKENSVLLQELKQVSENGWKRLIERMTNGRVEDRRNRVIGEDVTFMVVGGTILKGAKFLLAKSLSAETLASVKGYLGKLLGNHNAVINKVTARFSTKKVAEETVERNVVVRFASESEALAFLSNKLHFSSGLKKVGSFLKQVAEESWKQKGYIATAQSIQIGVESYYAGLWKFSEPITLANPVESKDEFLQQLVNDESIMHNVKYMTMQTTLLSGMEETLDHKGYGLKVKVPVCSLITFVDSMSMNVLFNDHANMKRVGFDTGWELLIGTNQVLLDKTMMRKMEQMAIKLKKPKVAFLGWILAGVDQFAGYTFYNKATKKFFPPSKEDSEGKETIANVEKSTPPPIVVIPVLAPK